MPIVTVRFTSVASPASLTHRDISELGSSQFSQDLSFPWGTSAEQLESDIESNFNHISGVSVTLLGDGTSAELNYGYVKPPLLLLRNRFITFGLLPTTLMEWVYK